MLAVSCFLAKVPFSENPMWISRERARRGVGPQKDSPQFPLGPKHKPGEGRKASQPDGLYV